MRPDVGIFEYWQLSADYSVSLDTAIIITVFNVLYSRYVCLVTTRMICLSLGLITNMNNTIQKVIDKP